MSIGETIVSKLPPWLIATIFISISVITLLLFVSDRTLTCTLKEGISCGVSPSKGKVATETYYGYYYNLDENSRLICDSETVEIGFSGDEVPITAHSAGMVRDRDGTQSPNKWVFQGYKHGSNLALAYVTEQKPTSGNGVYYLIKNQGEYAGFWAGVNGPTGKIISCPYVLTKTAKRANESCQARWPRVFTASTGCREVLFPEGS
ncbi:MAG: hypothetical protein EOO23_08615 [Comamonadaceae bacterium]|nr:MAG: hypothetical protein EOO23_08615 [Comamonadaceae bacterium]